MQLQSYTKQFSIEKPRSDQELLEAIDKVRTILNASRKEAGYKPLPFAFIRKKLKERGFTTVDSITRLVSGCRDAMNPSRTLNYKLLSKQ